MKRFAILSGSACLAALAGCQSASQTAGGNSAAVALLQQVNADAHACWSKDKSFAGYSVIPELDTEAGKPRILLVDKKAQHGLPKLVIEANGTPPKVAVYGPLLTGPVGARISADLKRWTGGANGCVA